MLGPLAAAPGTQLGPLAVGRSSLVTGPVAVTWTQIVNATVEAPNTLRAGATSPRGACSTLAIPSGDGYVEFTATAADRAVFGLSNGNTDAQLADIDFAMYTFFPSLLIFVYEKGVAKGSAFAYTPGATLRISVTSGVVEYKLNGVVKYTSLAAPTFPLLGDAHIPANAEALYGATIYAANGLVPSGY